MASEQSVKEKVSIRVSPLVFIGVSVGLLAISSFALLNALSQKTLTSKKTVTPVPTTAELQKRFVTSANEYLQAPTSEQATKLTALKTSAADRQVRLSTVLKTNPAEFTQLAVRTSDWEQLPLEVRPLVEQEVEIEGTLAFQHSDNVQKKTSTEQYFLQQSDGVKVTRTPVYFATAPLSDTTGATVKLKGWQLNGNLIASGSAETLQVISDTSVASVTGEKKVAVILFNFASNPNDKPITPANAYLTMFSDPLSVAAFYQKTSGGQLTLVGDSGGVPLTPPNPNGNIYVYGWYTISANTNTCDWSTWLDLAEAQAPIGALDGFDNFVFASPKVSSCGFSGAVDVANSFRSYINVQLSIIPPFPLGVAAHELGHNFEVGHANSLECVDTAGNPTPFSLNCTSTEYGDPYDPMGWIRNGTLKHFNNYYQGVFGWYSPQNVQDITTSGTYPLYPIEADDFGAQVRTLRLPTTYRVNGGTIGGYYSLEYRRPFNPFDTYNPTDRIINGLTIRLVPNNPSHYMLRKSQLVDLTPSTSTYAPSYDEMLMPGGTFTDSTRGLSLSVSIPQDKLTANVTVSLTCLLHKTPSMGPGPDEIFWFRPGQPKTKSLTLTNNDPVASDCGSSNFSVTPVLPAGWTHSTIGSFLLEPGQSSNFSVIITPPVGTPDGYYTLTFDAFSQDRPADINHFESFVGIDTVAPPAIMVSPADNSNIPEFGTVSVTINSGGSGGDGDDVANKEIVIDGVTVRQCRTYFFFGPCTYDWVISGNVASGLHTIKAITTDWAGNADQKTINVCYPYTSTGRPYLCAVETQ